jgi:capsular polysaccharide biosynthesis protein
LSLARLRRFAARCVAEAGESVHAAPDKIYVSRALSANRAPSYRVLTNESEIEDIARARGFQIVYPEALSLSGQCALFHRARAIMGPSGSGMLNAAFAPEGAKLADIEIFTYTVRQHAKLYSSSGKSYGFVFGESFAEDVSQRLHAPWKVDPALVSQAIALITI